MKLTQAKIDEIVNLYQKALQKDVRSPMQFVIQGVSFDTSWDTVFSCLTKSGVSYIKADYHGKKNPRWKPCVFDSKEFLWQKLIKEGLCLQDFAKRYNNVLSCSCLCARFKSYFGVGISEARRDFRKTI